MDVPRILVSVGIVVVTFTMDELLTKTQWQALVQGQTDIAKLAKVLRLMNPILTATLLVALWTG